MAAYNNTLQILNVSDMIKHHEGLAMAAVKSLTDLEGTGMSDAENARIAGLLESAEEDLGVITDILAEDGALMAAVDAVLGTSSDTPTEIAMANRDTVAEAIADAIQGTGLDTTTPFSAWTSIAHADVPDHDPIPGDDDPIMRAGKSGKTFAQISGSEGPMKVALADVTTVAGDAITTVTGTAADAAYKGIPGNLICVITTGDCDADSGTVYFVPDSPFALYKSDGDDGYEQQMNAAFYGYWLNDSAAIQNHFTSDSGTLDWTDGDADTAAGTTTATYQGMAGGFSERTVDETQMSGEFTANVNLKATFADTGDDTLQGTINGFAAKPGASGSGHVNPAWVIGLLRHSAAFADNAVLTNATPGTFSTEYRNGEEGATGGNWTATAYGDGTKHPTGFVGAFNADFEDGSAAGVYNAD
jgi:hypothetical protein